MLVFGWENRVTVNVLININDNPQPLGVRADEYLLEKQRVKQKAHKLTRPQLGRSAVHWKDRYAINVKETRLPIGSRVWYLYQHLYVGGSPKWQMHYTGPYLVVRVMSSTKFVIQKSRESTPFVVHKDKLKLCLTDAPASLVVAEPSTPRTHFSLYNVWRVR